MEKCKFEQLFCCAVTESPERNKLYQLITNSFDIKTALYPGCGMDIAPSLYVPMVSYLDQAPEVLQFFEEKELLQREMMRMKSYQETCQIEFFGCDYNRPPDIPQYDLLISQYAGNVGQAMKPFLKTGGILLVADGPADYQLALQDPDYQFLGTIKRSQGRLSIVPELLPPEKRRLTNGMEISLARDFCFKKR